MASGVHDIEGVGVAGSTDDAPGETMHRVHTSSCSDSDYEAAEDSLTKRTSFRKASMLSRGTPLSSSTPAGPDAAVDRFEVRRLAAREANSAKLRQWPSGVSVDASAAGPTNHAGNDIEYDDGNSHERRVTLVSNLSLLLPDERLPSPEPASLSMLSRRGTAMAADRSADRCGGRDTTALANESATDDGHGHERIHEHPSSPTLAPRITVTSIDVRETPDGDHGDTSAVLLPDERPGTPFTAQLGACSPLSLHGARDVVSDTARQTRLLSHPLAYPSRLTCSCSASADSLVAAFPLHRVCV